MLICLRGEAGSADGVAGTTGTRLVAQAIAVGQYHACALLSSGAIQCWGDNTYDQLDSVSTETCNPVYNRDEEKMTTDLCNLAPTTVASITNATALVAGMYHTCALLTGGTVQCWGANYLGQLGIGSTTLSSVPVAVPGIADATMVTSGYHHNCAVLVDGSLRCWGANLYGQLGNGTSTNNFRPVTVSAVTNAAAVAAGFAYTCALLTDGTVWCWGGNSEGELGNGTSTELPGWKAGQGRRNLHRVRG